MIKQKYNLDDLLTQLREKGERNIEDIEYAILENNGTLSVFPYSNKRNKSPIPMPIILDGKIQYDMLRAMNKDDKFIDNLLKNNNLALKDISIFVIKYIDLE